jgi:hypothetical protein
VKAFNREKFLLFMLAGIFIWQAAIFSYGVIGCFENGGKEACPDLGNRYENTVNVMVATTLALLGAGAVASVSQKKASTSDPALPLDEQPRQLPRRRSPGKTSAAPAQASEEQVEPQEQTSSQASGKEKKR